MKKILLILLTLSFAVTSCITVSSKTEVPVEPSFVTSTLPPTKSLVTRPTATKTGLPKTPTLAVTVPPDCKVVAVLIEDVTIPDGTQVTAGKSFTKTWKFKNTGTCPWSGYTLAFASGDRMEAPDSAPVPQTLAGDTVDVSVDLVAPSKDGSYTGFFELHDAAGEVVPIGLEKTFWVKIDVGSGGSLPTAAPGATLESGGGSNGGGNCQASENAGYVGQVLDLINAERADAHVPSLSLNAQLSAAAQAHSVDMACNNFISHTGSNGSSIQQRIAAAGYVSSYSLEIIAVGGPQDAMAQWNDDPLHHNAIVDRNVTEVGIGWADSPNSGYGGHFTVDLASP
jgi:uncharacterized protein YkwD